MKLRQDYKIPNISDLEIPTDFVVIHYTACELRKTLEIFMDPNSKLSSHFVIDADGTCYDLGNFFDGPILKAAHAGISRIELEGVEDTSLNNISVGIELVNLNGNIFPYTKEQYESLAELLSHLQKRFAVLGDPRRIIGHEHIASFRGKADPGVEFDWNRLFGVLGMKMEACHHFHACREEDVEYLKKEISTASTENEEFWSALSAKLELRLAQAK